MALPKNIFVETITTSNDRDRDQSIEALCEGQSLDFLLESAEILEKFWMQTDNLYHRVRALFFLFYFHRFEFPKRISQGESSNSVEREEFLTAQPIPEKAHRALQKRNFADCILLLLERGICARLNMTLSTGLAQAYHGLALQSLADQVKRSVRSEVGNQWMFRIGHPDDYPLRIRKELSIFEEGSSPWLVEETAVRMDLSHSCWSDIFFLGMDRPQFAKVINASVDLVVRGSSDNPSPPCLSAIRIIDRPIIRLVSLDLGAQAEVDSLKELFDFGKDYLGLLKAALIASGLIPSGLEGMHAPISDVLEKLVGKGRGIELVSWVKDIPKGSRLAVSTNLLGGLIAVCMRASEQVQPLTGPLNEEDRRMVASRAILGEWLGGSGGGWQDSGGVWPGIKLIEGCWEDGSIAEPMIGKGLKESQTSKMGALLPRHTRLDPEIVSDTALGDLERSLILVHGGMAANVGPILEMVTERYLLRSEDSWEARLDALNITSKILENLQIGNIRELAKLTTRNFFGPIKGIIPWASNAFTEALISEVAVELESLSGGSNTQHLDFAPSQFEPGNVFWGFWMLGGMSGGGMGFIVNPAYQDLAKDKIGEILLKLKHQFESSLPFAMDPVIYDFRFNKNGSFATNAESETAIIESFQKEYLKFRLPMLLQLSPKKRTAGESGDLGAVNSLQERYSPEFLAALLPSKDSDISSGGEGSNSLDRYLDKYGFDGTAHEQIREDLIKGRLGLSQNRLHPKTRIEDVKSSDLLTQSTDPSIINIGENAIKSGKCGVITLAAGAGSRWTKGAGVVKALHPFAPLENGFNSFLDIHLRKSSKVGELASCTIPHAITTSYLTHPAIEFWQQNMGSNTFESVKVYLSEGQSIGLRMVPTQKDLHYLWYELPQDKLDQQAEKMRDSVRQSLMGWAQDRGEASDYRDNLATQCLHPVGHWYEFPNLFLNGVLHDMLSNFPDLQYLLLHNIDTLGVELSPEWLGLHIQNKSICSFEVMQRGFHDVGGGLAKVNGRLRLVEGFALPFDNDEYKLSYYNTLSTWIDLHQLLNTFDIPLDWFSGTKSNYTDKLPLIRERVRQVAQELPTYITIKEAKKRWGRGQEDIYPVAQFERLWGDMSAFLPLIAGEQAVQYFLVDKERGMQLKNPDELDSVMREGFLSELEKRI